MFGAGEGGRTLAGECVHALATVWAGGAGADVFHIFAGGGSDQVLDFTVAEGDRVQLSPGQPYSLSQSGADTVIELSSGDRLVLIGVQLSSLPNGWIFSA